MPTADPAQRPPERPPGESAEGPGELLVRLLSCVERATDRVERVLPSVDHLALRRTSVPPSSVLVALRRSGLADLVEPFESWQHLLQDFDSSVATLTEIRDGGPGEAADYQSRLGGCIDDARRCRHAVEEAAEDIRRKAAAEIDAALAHEEGLRRTTP